MTQFVVVVFLKLYSYLHKETILCFKLTSLCASHKCAVDDSFQIRGIFIVSSSF